MGLNKKLPNKEQQQVNKKKVTGIKVEQKYRQTSSKFIPTTKNQYNYY